MTAEASSSDIKKAYYKRARELHPDKNRGDPAAHSNFQAAITLALTLPLPLPLPLPLTLTPTLSLSLSQPAAHSNAQAVGEAYQVLSSEELRARYDKEGKKALEEHALVDTPHYNPSPSPNPNPQP